MRSILKGVAMGLMAVAMLIGSAPESFAKPKLAQYRLECTCTCVAYDSNGNRHEGRTMTFNTTWHDCTIGANVGCYVEDLKGAFLSCLGHGIDVRGGAGLGAGSGAVLDPGSSTAPSRFSPAVAPALR